MLLAMTMEDNPKRSINWPDIKVPQTKAAQPAPRIQPY
jgi:hypothetical protein